MSFGVYRYDHSELYALHNWSGPVMLLLDADLEEKQ